MRIKPVLFRHHNGQSLIEVIIAVAFATVIIIALVNVTIQSMKNASFARNNTQATKLAQEGIEWIRSQRDQRSWSDLEAFANNNYCLNNPDWTFPVLCTEISCTNSLQNIYKRCVSFSAMGGGTCGDEALDATVEVVWNDTSGEHKSVQKTCFSNWQRR